MSVQIGIEVTPHTPLHTLRSPQEYINQAEDDGCTFIPESATEMGATQFGSPPHAATRSVIMGTHPSFISPFMRWGDLGESE